MSDRKMWIEFAVLAVSAVSVVVVADSLLHFIAPPRHLREVEDGVRELRREEPTVLMLGSSHARTFHVVGQELARRTGGTESVVAVPLEFGKIYTYDWLLHHRISPIIDRRDASTRSGNARLKRFVLLTAWWDFCTHAAPYWNLPGRAWEFGDFVEHVLQHGITAFNRNYVQNRFRVLFAESALVHDRTQRVLVSRIGRLVRGKPFGRTQEQEQQVVDRWRRMIERGATCIGDAVQTRSFHSILSFARARRLQTTVVLFPLKPATLTETAKSTTIAAFARQTRILAESYGAKVVDLTDRSPLGDADFMEDFDHVTEEGDRRFAGWVLDNDLRFLLAPASDAGRAAGNRQPR